MQVVFALLWWQMSRGHITIQTIHQVTRRQTPPAQNSWWLDVISTNRHQNCLVHCLVQKQWISVNTIDHIVQTYFHIIETEHRMYWYVRVCRFQEAMIYIFRSSLPQEFNTQDLNQNTYLKALRPRHSQQRAGATLAMDLCGSMCTNSCSKALRTVGDDHQGHGLIMDSLDQRWRIEDFIDVFDMTTTNDLVKEGEQERENPKLESIWIIWKWTFDFREVLSVRGTYEHCLWTWCGCCGECLRGHEFLCDTLSSSRGWWDARICGAAPRESLIKIEV